MLILVLVSTSLLLLFYAYHMVNRIGDLQSALVTLENQKSVSKADRASIDAKEAKIEIQLNRCVLDIMKVWRPLSELKG